MFVTGGDPPMKRLLCFAVALCVALTLCLSVPAAGLAQAAVETAPLTGAQYYPDGSDAQTAGYAFYYAYPQFEPVDAPDIAINAYYAALAADVAGAGVAAAVADIDALPAAGSPAYYTKLDYRVTFNTEDYLSVLLTSLQFLGNAETESLTANVFARSGVYAGQAVSLSQAIGLEQEDGAAAEENSYAAELAYGLIWQIIQSQQAMQQRDYFPELTQADLQTVLNPESDFYMDENGNFVFYIQSGAIASEVEGMLTYPFSAAELFSAARQ